MNYHKDYKLASQNVYNTCTALFLKMTTVFLKVTPMYLSTRGSCGHLLAFASTGITRDGAFVTKFTALIFVFHPSAISDFSFMSMKLLTSEQIPECRLQGFLANI
jgi:hypothetical protein